VSPFPEHDDRRLDDQDERTRIVSDLDATLFVEAGAGSGKTKSLVDRVVALVEAGTAMSAIATITFTEKAAAELRDRVRRALERRRADAALPTTARERAAEALDQLDQAAISTLHAFAQRILSEHPIEAALPPNVEVLDEVASEIEFEERWQRFRDALLDDEDLERTLLLAFAAGIEPADLRHLATVFQDNWDLIADPARVPWASVEPPRIDAEPLIERVTALLDRRVDCTDGGDLLCLHLTETIEPHLEQLRKADDELDLMRLLHSDRPRYACKRGRKENWPSKAAIIDELTAIEEAITDLSRQVALDCVQRIAAEVARFTLDAAAQRRAGGRLEFHDLLVMARDLLRGPQGVGVRERLRRRYQRLLLDEFQDTDPIQIDLAVLIAATQSPVDADWSKIEVEPGRLFFVGDPKQSIYRFRRADIALFLRARDRFGPALQLRTNFRTTPPVIDWVNHVFGRLITSVDDQQPAYQPLAPAPGRQAPPDDHPVVVLGAAAHPDTSLHADELRDLEAADVAAAVRTALTWQVSRRAPTPGAPETWQPATPGDITILLPARTSLPALERALEAAGIDYRAETSSLVYATREIRELMATVRALVDPTDQLALTTALRSPVFGCGDDDLFTYRVTAHGRWDLLARPPEGIDPEHPVVAALRWLRGLHAELPWLAPAELLDRIARERRLYELGHAQGRPRDLWRRLRFVIDQARAWSEAEGGTLREYVTWARLQASDTARVAETILPETDDSSVRIMTIHGSKGLEFPITIVSGLTTASRGATSRVEVLFPPDGPIALRVGPKIVSDEFEALQPVEEQMSYQERLRLLYVACTRAQDHLVVSLHRRARKGAPDERRKYTNAELLAEACDGLDLQTLGPLAAATPAAPGPVPTPMLPLEEWEAVRGSALAASARRRSLGASDVALPELEPEPEPDDIDGNVDDVAAGREKDARDLELPPWRKGRYGTAIGRAVHAVLQTADLATGAGMPESAAAQAAAEGVIGREEDILRLARAARTAPSVQEAVTAPRWRETYVATTIEDRTLEGYIDLLYRTATGLVVVDYKTASSTADLDRRVEAYRAQGGAYALAVEGATGEAVARVVFVFLTPGGAVERDLPDLRGAMAAVRAAMAVPS
jgi:ATP-dependent helicase/nuclease subunit A